MRLFLLKAIKEVGYDSYDSFVVRASSEYAARAFVQEESYGDEKTKLVGTELMKIPFWLSDGYSTCEEINEEGETMILCSSYNAG